MDWASALEEAVQDLENRATENPKAFFGNKEPGAGSLSARGMLAAIQAAIPRLQRLARG